MTSLLCAGLFSGGAFAADVSIKGSLSQAIEGSDNYFLSPNPLGTTFKSLSALNLDVLARTPGTRYLLSSNVSYYDYFGPGAKETNPTNGTPFGESFRVDHTTELAKYFVAASFSRADIAATQLRESGIVTASGSIDSTAAVGGFTRDIDRRNSLTWSAQVNRTTFENSTQTPFTDYATSLSWIHILSPTTTLTTALNFDWLASNDAAQSQRLFWQFTSGIRSQLTRRLVLTASAGLIAANAWHRNDGGALQSAVPESGAASGWIAQGGINYQLLKITTVSLSAAHLIVPTSFGQLQNTTTAGLSLGHDVNFRSKLLFGVNFAHTSAGAFGGINANFFSAQAAYSYRIARDWNARLSYTFRQRDDGGAAQSNSVLLSLRYDFNVLGNPSALDAVEIGRALSRQQRAVGEIFPTLR